MRRSLIAVAAVAALALTIAGAALAHDCIRVSASLQGLKQSTKSGNWLLFDVSSPAAVQETFKNVVGEDLPADAAKCVADEYAKSGQTPYFALGIGVAGPNGVLVGHNKNENVLANAKGIDHFEVSPVGGALFGSLGACGIEVDEEEE